MTRMVLRYFRNLVLISCVTFSMSIGVSPAEAVSVTEVVKLLAADGQSNAGLGYSVAIDGNRAVVGAPGDAEHGTSAGAAYVYTRDESGWSQHAKLVSDSIGAGDRFGESVSISGDLIAIGAPHAVGGPNGGAPCMCSGGLVPSG